MQRHRLGPRGVWLATLTCGLVWLLAFALPVSQLLFWAIREIDSLDRRYWLLAANSLQLALGAALLLPALALALSWAQRRAPSAAMGWLARLATLGYAMPGALLAVAFFAAVGAQLDPSTEAAALPAQGRAQPLGVGRGGAAQTESADPQPRR